MTLRANAHMRFRRAKENPANLVRVLVSFIGLADLQPVHADPGRGVRLRCWRAVHLGALPSTSAASR
jgi:hypothetical protein